MITIIIANVTDNINAREINILSSNGFINKYRSIKSLYLIYRPVHSGLIIKVPESPGYQTLQLV